jgi:zinc protease
MSQKFFSKSFTLVALLFITVISVVSGQDLNSPLPFDTTVTTGTLSNGLKYYIKPNPKPEKKVELRLAINAGSILENNDQQGLAHFMEHMNFNGTEHYPKNELVDFLQSIGVQFGADLNAYTSFDETVYILPIPTDKPDNLSNGFEVLSDWAHNALITDKDVNEERKVVLEESRGGKGAQDRMMKVYLPKLMAGSHYAERLPIGKDEILKNCDPEAIRSFYRDWYRPDLMAVAVVGDVSVAQAKALIEKYFAPLTNPDTERTRVTFDVPAYKAKEAMVLTDIEETNQSFSLNYSSKKSKSNATLQEYRSSIVKSCFEQILNTRLQDLTQTANPPYLYSYAGIGGWSRGYESFSLTTVASNDMKTAINASIGEIVKVQKFGFTQAELDVVKKSMLSYMERSYNERNTTESGRYVDELVRNFLTQESVPGTASEYEYYKIFLPGITVDEVNVVAQNWLDDNKTYFAMCQGPENSAVKNLTSKKLLKWVNEAFKQNVEAHVERALATSLLAEEPVAGKILSVENDTLLGVNTYTLSNGIKVTVKSTNFKSDQILMMGEKKGGSGQYGVADKLNTMFMNEMISTMGYGQFSPIDLSKFLAGKNARIATNFSGNSNGVFGNSTVKDLETMMQLNYLKLTSPRKDMDLFQGSISNSIAGLKDAKSSPEAAFIDSMVKVFYKGQPFAPINIPTEAELKSTNLDRIIEIYKTEFGNADGFHFFFVGNVDEKILLPLVEKYMASLPTKGTIPMSKDNGLRPIYGRNEFVFHKGKEPKSLVLAQFYGELPFSHDAALKADLLGEILNIKIIEELREKIGGIYSGGIYSDVSDEPYDNYSFVLYLPCGPESVDTLIKASMAEIDRIKREGPSIKDLEKVKLAKVEAYRESIKTNGYWGSYLGKIKCNGYDARRFLEYESVVNAVTAEQIRETANLMLSGENTFKAILYPEK